MQRYYIGTSGWNYDHWKGVFYEDGCPKSRWLEWYGRHFQTVEVNATFYRSMKPQTFENWYRNTPDGFLWSVKANRFITHIKRLKDAEEPLGRFLESVTPLREKLGPILFQLPPSLVFNQMIAETFFRHLLPARRYTLEARHESWLEPEALKCLEQYGIAWCISDTAGRYPYREAVTADFVYIRLHGSQKLYASRYSDKELKAWADRITSWNLDTYVYFDNDFKGYAPQNALELIRLLKYSD